jgi:SAM-dependent methyltransferase
MPQFDAREYWNGRLESRWTIGGTGHLQYSAAYNRWLYRAKHNALRAVLRGVDPAAAFDVGSGVGWVVRQLLADGWSVRGCDIAPVAVDRLREELPDVQFDLVDVGREPLPVPDGTMDLVTAIDVIYHVVDGDAFAHVLAEGARVLTPGGRLIVTDTMGAHDDVPAEHVHFRGARTWRATAASVGLDIVDVRPYFRWLSRPPERSTLRRLPDSMRGAVEYAVDRTLPLTPWMRLAVLRLK